MPKLWRARPPLDPTEERQVRELADSPRVAGSLRLHAGIVARSWEGLRTTAIADAVGCHVQTVRECLERFNADGLAGLDRQAGSGRKPRLTDEQRGRVIALATVDAVGQETRPADATAPTRTLASLTTAAQAEGIAISESQVRRILQAAGVDWRSSESDVAVDEHEARALRRFEEAIAQLTSGSSFDSFRGDVHPVEIATRLAEAMEDHVETVPYGMRVPEDYSVWLSSVDYGRFAPLLSGFENELATYLWNVASACNFQVTSNIMIHLAPVADLARHSILVEARYRDSRVSTDPSTTTTSNLRQSSRRARSIPEIRIIDPHIPDVVTVDRLPFSLGRSLDNDMSIEDTRVSRYHALIKEINGYICLIDLQSMNGTFVNGEPIQECKLSHGDTISLGTYVMTIALGSRG